MDPLDPEYSFKFLTGGAPIKIEKVLDIEVKPPDNLKTVALVTAMAATVAAGVAAAYYWFKQPDDEDDEPDIDIEDEESGDTIITTMTTTTTTTSYMTPQNIQASSSSNTSTRLPLQPPKPTNITPYKLIDENGQPLSLEEQNKILLSENKIVKKDLESLNNWVNDQMSGFEERLHRLEVNNIRRVRDLESDLDKERYCGICQENEKQVCWTNCGHRLCARCAIVIKSTPTPICPHCRSNVDHFVKCYNT